MSRKIGVIFLISIFLDSLFIAYLYKGESVLQPFLSAGSGNFYQVDIKGLLRSCKYLHKNKLSFLYFWPFIMSFLYQKSCRQEIIASFNYCFDFSFALLSNSD